MNIKKHFFLSNPILKNILILFSGTGIAQIIPFVATFVLSRIYTKTDFGDLSLIMSISGILGVVVALRYELVIVLQRKVSNAKSIMALSFSLTLFFSFLFFFFLYVLHPILEDGLDISDYSLLYYTPIIIAGIGIYNVFDNWFNRQREYKNMVYLKIIQSTISSSVKILLGVIGISRGLIGGTVIGYLVTVLACIYLFTKKDFFSCIYFSYKKMRALAISYKDFSLYATPSGLLNSMALTGLPMLITYFYSVDMAGLYFFSNNLIGMPVFFLANAVGHVFKKESVDLIHSNQIKDLNNLVRKFQQIVFLIILLYIFIFSLFGGNIFSFLFGSQWQESGNMIKFFGFYLLFGTCFSIISSLIDVLRLQKASLLFNASLLLSQIIVFAIFSRFLEFEYILLINSIVGSTQYFILDRYVKNKIKIKQNGSYK